MAGEFQRSAPERGRAARAAPAGEEGRRRISRVENVVAPRRVYDAKKARVLATVAGFGNPEGDAQRLADAQRPHGRDQAGRSARRTAAPRSSSSRSTCPTAAIRARSRSIPATRCRPTTPSTSRSSAPTRGTRCSFTKPENTRGLLYFKAALEAAGQSAFEIDPATPMQVSNSSPSKYAFVVLSDVGVAARRLRKCAARVRARRRRGADRARPHRGRRAARVPVSGRASSEARYAGREGERFQTVAWLDTSHPSILKDDRWDDVKFYQAIRVAPGSARVVGAAQRPDAAAARSADGRRPRRWSSPPRSTTSRTISRCTRPSCRSSTRRRATWDGSRPDRAGSAGRVVRGTARCQGKGRGGGRGRSQGRAGALARGGHQGAEHSVHAWPASTISAGPTGATNWWR